MISNILAFSYFSIEPFYFTLAGFPGGQMVKNLPAMQETQVQSLHWKDLEKGMASHSSFLYLRIPWAEVAGGL